MSFLKTVADFFKSSPNGQTRVDKYNLVSPIIATVGYVESTKRLLDTVVSPSFSNILTNGSGVSNPHEVKGRAAYKAFVGGLTGFVRDRETAQPFSMVRQSLDHIKHNLELIEDNLIPLFGDIIGSEEEQADTKTSTLIVLGYIEMANEFMNWIGHLVVHISPKEDSVPPYWTKSLLEDAHKMGDYVMSNIIRWDPKTNGILSAVKELQAKGSDVAVKTGDMWLDEIVHDSQFTTSNQNLISASFRNPTLWLSDRKVVNYQKKVNLYTSRKEWLLSKIALEEAKLAGTTTDSVEYKKLKKTVDFYAAQVTKWEQELERLRS